VVWSYSISPLRDAEGKITGIFGIVRDVTGRKQKDRNHAPFAEEYSSKAMRSTLSMARRAAPLTSTVLLLGESGSGKDYVAKYIHDNSTRTNGPYFAVNCAAISSTLAESELFGHEKGAFTGAAGRKRGMLELAEGGTLLLNEIGDLPLLLQAKLLTFLDTKKFTRVGGEREISVNARIIAATNRDLEKAVEEGTFRHDLFYRFSVIKIKVPPLRERMEDIPALAKEIVSRLATDMQLKSVPPLDAAMMEALAQYHWPGNVRELRNVLERALIVSEGKRCEILLPSPSNSRPRPEVATGSEFRGRTLREVTDEITRAMCLDALEQCNGNKREAARILGIARDSLYRYLKQFGILTNGC
jgi:DNA-binding NtrC family response regulator